MTNIEFVFAAIGYVVVGVILAAVGLKLFSHLEDEDAAAITVLWPMYIAFGVLCCLYFVWHRVVLKLSGRKAGRE